MTDYTVLHVLNISNNYNDTIILFEIDSFILSLLQKFHTKLSISCILLDSHSFLLIKVTSVNAN